MDANGLGISHTPEPVTLLAVESCFSHTCSQLQTAEDAAVGYCERRCVGVPTALRTPVCSGTLRVRLQHLRPKFRYSMQESLTCAEVVL